MAERLRRGVRVTAAGRAVADEARIALQAARQAVQTGRRVGQGGAGRIRIACSETLTAWLLLPVLQQWRCLRQDVHLELLEFTNTDVMLELLEAGQIDVAFGPRPTRGCSCHIDVIGEQDAVVVAAAGHPYAELPHIPIEDLDGQPFIHYDSENALAAWVDQLAAHHDILLNTVLRTRSPRTAVQLAAAGMGITIAPTSALPTRLAGTVRRLKPLITIDVIVIVDARSDHLVQQFVSDVHRRGLPRWDGPATEHAFSDEV
ncbi:LysR family transcriptional regulator [Mycobacterium montefiorense]|uniref:LysR family transcriptional regulator n=1 Tax=Mycobacterium montefiorense TaxID=154654 RepID=A0AA37PRS9_9MYCO|nr:LysR family transcriptional regulator [Mycobacterium montefiorense]GKU53153.1 LysR family transcriptional regulator [Mycobacterium montefiorense]GKU54625.1 LysR family transcriptional regulator [Mycobacterium montefiorense]GKU70115.1 LysR family transcriptional regulator [Mycobacterium montefiorense]GKU74987.1 LysR family transcriptional regulator [Mycobacterium montefiorense]